MKKQTINDKYMKRKYVNWNNYTPSKGETNSGELLLVEDDSLSITQILERYAKGMPLPSVGNAFYSDSDDFNDVDILTQAKDPTEVDQLVSERNERKRDKAKRVIQANKLDESGPSKSPEEEKRDFAGNNSNQP